ncbi:MAG: hypothetical protein V2I51_00555 [Anderseniella sp.]|jgi:hypothetical protein|nr:hypothetical protein [Anderseniella sp.]
MTIKKLALIPVLLAGLAAPALASETTTTTTAPNKVTLQPAPGVTESSAAATVTTEQDAALKRSKAKGGHSCGGAKTTAYIN